ncbi:ricin-type beta-trefoil lectin domain protein [Kribbella sp. NPDC000426]|uniref:ricin-type beta-trefoil lectin domain protein n=1 Tax=Kribbella sp. NPDC000426 TaxID=3154255 RepID=UPI003328A0FB
MIRVAAFLAAILALTGLTATPAAVAGSPSDYPEYPYAATDYTEPFRGQFHFSPQNGFMNDINAPLYYRGVYHLFFQHNPHGLGWDAAVHWGHATSTDLVHWTQQPIALEPGVQSGNLWSGSGWVDVNNVTGLKVGSDDPILLFTNTDGVSIAYSTDGAKTFQMYNGGAKVITDPVESRDPKVQWDPDHNRWELVTFRAGTGAAFYTSTNLLDWTYRGAYAASWFVECPDLYQLPLDGNVNAKKWVLQDASGEYVVGSLDANGLFVADSSTQQRMEWGVSGAAFPPSTWYAPQTFNQLPNGRVVQLAWQPTNAGVTWTGNASFPVELALKTYPEGIRITRNPVSEISMIRTSTQTWGARTIDPATDPLSGISADTYELTAQFDLTGVTASEFGFRLHARSDGSSDRTVAYSVGAQTLYGASMPPISNLVTIRLLVDRGQLEVFGNDGKTVVSDNVAFDSSSGTLGIHLYAAGGAVTLTSLTFSPIGSTWTPAPEGAAPAGGIASTARQDMCVDRDVASGKVQLWTCLANSNQTWSLDSLGQLTTGGVCLEVPSGQTANLTLVHVATCTGGSNQIWREGNYGTLINLASGRCLDLPEADFTNGRQLQIYDCVGTRNQSWVGPDHTT